MIAINETPPTDVPTRRWRADALAGLTTAVMLVPQAMAYATLAGLPPAMGLYAALLPLLAYAAVGSSPVLAVGPVALDSLLVAAGVGVLATAGTPRYIELAILLAALVGALQIALGAVRAGFLVNLMAQPVISGFMSAAALIIALSQVPTLVGVPSGPRDVLGALRHLGAVLPQAGGATAALGLGAAAVLAAIKRWRPGWPGPLLVVVGGTAAVAATGLAAHGVAIVGAVPQGLPRLRLPAAALDDVLALLPTAAAIALVAYVEAISVGSAFARRMRRELRPNRELVALGLGNVAAGISGGYPVTGGLSRTAVNARAGATSQRAAVVTAAVVALLLLWLTPLLHNLPRAVLAAIVVVAVSGLVEWREPLRLWRVKRADLGLWLLTFAGTLALGALAGIGVGVAASLLNFVLRTTRPHTAVLGRLPGTHDYRNVRNYPQARTFPGVILLRMDAQLYFGNMAHLKRQLRAAEAALDQPLKAVVLDASANNQLDSSAAATLQELAADYQRRGVVFGFAQVKVPVLAVMEDSGLVATIGREHVYMNLDQAVADVTGWGDAPTWPVI